MPAKIRSCWLFSGLLELEALVVFWEELLFLGLLELGQFFGTLPPSNVVKSSRLLKRLKSARGLALTFLLISSAFLAALLARSINIAFLSGSVSWSALALFSLYSFSAFLASVSNCNNSFWCLGSIFSTSFNCLCKVLEKVFK